MRNYIVIFIGILFGCNSSVEQPGRWNYSLNNFELEALIKDYYQDNIISYRTNDNVEGVIELTFKKENDTTYVYIGSNINELNDNSLPSHYFFLDDIPVVVQTGMEDVFSYDSSYIKDMQKDLSPYLHPYLVDEETGEIISLPINYNPVVWEVKILEGQVISKKQIN